MLTLDDTPSIAALQPELAPHRDNLSIEGTLVCAGPLPDHRAGCATIAVGEIFLAKGRGIESWHECEVIKRDGDLLTLVWSGLPESEVFTRRCWQLGSLHLSAVTPC